MTETPKTTGLQRLEQLVGHASLAPMVKLLNQTILSVGPGRAVIESRPDPQFENSMGRMHGGYVAALIDTALGCAVLTTLDAKTGYGTIDLSVKFTRKIDADTGALQATGTVIHAGRTMITAEAKVVGLDGKIYAHGAGTFLVYPV